MHKETNLTEHELSYRAVTCDSSVKLIFENNELEVTSEISFDSKGDCRSAVNYFLSSIIGGILHHIMETARRSHIILDDVEAKLHISLKNPLTFLGVIGYTDLPVIENCRITLYMYTEMEEPDVLHFIEKSLETCFIYQTIRKAVTVDINFVPVL